MKKPKVEHRMRSKIMLLMTMAFGGLFILWVIGVWLFGTIYQRQHRGDKVIIGVSFAKETAEDMGVDWQANYTSLLDDMKVRDFRLMSYWSQIEPKRGEYNFEYLDWQFAEAEKRGAKISLSIGLRQPRWPECHQAQWASELYKSNYVAWGQELSIYMTDVVNRYRSSPSLESWHLENEYYNRNFGECVNFSTKRLSGELALIKNLDPTHPVVLSLSDQIGFPWGSLRPDTVATSLYRSSYVKPFGNIQYKIIPTQFYSAKAYFINLLKGRGTYIHELQLEPWGPKVTKELSIAEQDKYMSTDQIKENIEFGLNTGMKKMYLWGSEWWYWRKTTLNDPSIWDTVKDTISAQSR